MEPNPTTMAGFVFWLASAMLAIVIGVVGYLWRRLDNLTRAISELPSLAQSKAAEMDASLKTDIATMRAEFASHVSRTTDMHLQITKQMGQFPTRDELNNVVDRGVERILAVVQRTQEGKRT